MSVLMMMRHGQARFGSLSYDALSATGESQARATGQWLGERDLAPFRCWVGPRSRHLDTANTVIEHAGWASAVTTSKLLDEFGEGEDVLQAAEELFQKPMRGAEAPERREQMKYYSRALSAWAEGQVALPGRPSFGAFRQQVATWLAGIIDDQTPGRREWVFTSAGVISAAVCEVMKLPDEQWHPLLRVIQNASLTEILFSPGQCSLRNFNTTAHLPAEIITSI